MKKSSIALNIQKAVASKTFPQRFSVGDVNRNCNDLLIKSLAFLSKHAKGNPRNYKPYYIRVARGKYKLIAS